MEWMVTIVNAIMAIVTYMSQARDIDVPAGKTTARFGILDAVACSATLQSRRTLFVCFPLFHFCDIFEN